MKRHSITAIVSKSHSLLLRAVAMEYPALNGLNRYRFMITGAAVSEIIRLESAPAPSEVLADNNKPGAGIQPSKFQERICGWMKGQKP